MPPLLSVRNLQTYFHRDGRTARAVDDVSFDIHPGETLALVGESGCGKSVTALSLLRLVPSPPGEIVGGEVLLGGRNVLRLEGAALRRVRGGEMAMIFQDPMASLNPVYTVGKQIAEALRVHTSASRSSARRRAIELLDRVGIPSPATRFDAYPHQLSGGMKQRVLIAMALACEPRLLIADEPTTALDVTIQAQVMDLLREVQKASGMSILLITHDVGVVAEMADRVAVMYGGKVMELAPVDSIFEKPSHPYTVGLFESQPGRHTPGSALHVIPGEVPDPFSFPSGCRFRMRCPLAVEACATAVPPLLEVARGHFSACIRVEDGKLPPVEFQKTATKSCTQDPDPGTE
jgi:oligopeptide/dipeptide ABC transporter ATP-binding protein